MNFLRSINFKALALATVTFCGLWAGAMILVVWPIVFLYVACAALAALGIWFWYELFDLRFPKNDELES